MLHPLAINVDHFLQTLPVMGYGMLGITIVMLILFGLILGLNKLFPADKKKGNEK